MIYNKAINNLELLNLNGIKNNLSESIDKINKNNTTFVEGLNNLLEDEIKYREKSYALTNIKVAHFPYNRTIDEFDFDFQPSINKKEILDLATLRFLEEKKNILLLGTCGVGKTHLATSLGIEAAKKRYSVYFISCHDLITKLTNAHKENRLEAKIKHYCKYKLLIIDELGYLPVDKNGANMFFQLIAKRYEKNSTIITTNLPLSKWGEIFNDSTIASAILDRLVHHAYIINIKGKSYRLKDIVEEKEGRDKENV